jgi:hypothetical protein
VNDEQLVQNLVAAMQMGGDVRDFCRHPIYKELEKWIDSKVQGAHKDWMNEANKFKRDELWHKVQPYRELQDFLKKFILAGDTAAHHLKQMKEGEDL